MVTGLSSVLVLTWCFCVCLSVSVHCSSGGLGPVQQSRVQICEYRTKPQNHNKDADIIFKEGNNTVFHSLLQVNESVEVLVENVNDNPPNFAQNHFVLEVNEVRGVGVS